MQNGPAIGFHRADDEVRSLSENIAAAARAPIVIIDQAETLEQLELKLISPPPPALVLVW